jgi:hypothetical protein
MHDSEIILPGGGTQVRVHEKMPSVRRARRYAVCHKRGGKARKGEPGLPALFYRTRLRPGQ